jgi:SAM-dependent methyltransferase
MIRQKILDNLVCPRCFSQIKLVQDKLICLDCQREYLIINNKPCLLDKQGKGFNELSRDVTINKLKVFFKKYPKIFTFLYYAFGAVFVGKSARKAIENIGQDKLIINLGSGIKRIREDVINIDFCSFANVDLVADICHLPLRDNSVDVIINEFVLEHTKNPQVIVKEIYRVLKPGGLIYLAVPFVASFHSSPDDYYRWSKEGLRELLSDFKEEEIGIRCGPTSALVSIINEWLATLFSFGSRRLQQILLMVFMIITSPLKVFDYLIYRLPNAENIAYGFYYLGRKKRRS